jgi:FAD/FMN-containing dehydrogenase
MTVDHAHGCGGTSSAEHGIGLRKANVPASIAISCPRWAIKTALDPARILNPGNIYIAEGPG